MFKQMNFIMASGKPATWKIECDTLTKEDWEGLAAIASEILPPFGSVEGVPRGGIPFADALQKYVTTGPLLIADDVYTTGGSIIRYRKDRECIAVVAFSRGYVAQPWISSLFQLNIKHSQHPHYQEWLERRKNNGYRDNEPYETDMAANYAKSIRLAYLNGVFNNE